MSTRATPRPTPFATTAQPQRAPVPSPKLTFIPDILEEHLEEVQFLWAVRREALRASRFTPRELAERDERIEAHLDGIRAVGPAMRPFIEPSLAGDDPSAACAAALALLRSGDPELARLVVDRFAAADAGAVPPIAEALRHAAPHDVLPLVEAVSLSGSPEGPVNAVTASAALEILVWRGVSVLPDRVRALLASAEPEARRTAWRTLAALGALADPHEYSVALRDDDPLVRREAAWAAVWARVSGVLVIARRYADTPDPANADLYRVLAVLGTRDDLASVTRLAQSEALGAPAARLDLLVSFGPPGLAEPLIELMSGEDPEVAAAAGAAFARLTGVAVPSRDRKSVPPKEPTGDAAMDAAFAEEVELPDPERAREAWRGMAERLGGAEKICGGEDVSRGATAAQLARFDLGSRWEQAARNRFYGIAGPSLVELARFPYRP